MNPNRIPVTRVSRGGATGTPDDFDAQFTRRRKGSGRPEPRPQAKLQPIENKSMQDRIDQLGITEEIK